jgi:diaminopropionate ammonia-lyase
VVWFPKGVTQSRVDTAEGLGAKVVVSKVPYDETVALASKTARDNGWTLVQDTAWEGYHEVPTDIMAAYKLIALEAVEAMQKSKVKPTHVLLQVGVGSFAAAIAQYFRECAWTKDARIITLEPAGSDISSSSSPFTISPVFRSSFSLLLFLYLSPCLLN